MNRTWRVMQNPDSDKLYDVVHDLTGHPIYPINGYAIIASGLTEWQATLFAAAPDLLDIVRRLADNEEMRADEWVRLIVDAKELWAEMKGGGE